MSDSEQETLSPKEVSQWVRQEITNSTKAVELRVKEATDIMAQSAAGEISPKEAMQRVIAYQDRWGEALHGAVASETVSNEQILAKIDEMHQEDNRQFSKKLDASKPWSPWRGGR